jgi:hypothetical protein
MHTYDWCRCKYCIYTAYLYIICWTSERHTPTHTYIYIQMHSYLLPCRIVPRLQVGSFEPIAGLPCVKTFFGDLLPFPEFTLEKHLFLWSGAHLESKNLGSAWHSQSDRSVWISWNLFEKWEQLISRVIYDSILSVILSLKRIWFLQSTHTSAKQFF